MGEVYKEIVLSELKIIHAEEFFQSFYATVISFDIHVEISYYHHVAAMMILNQAGNCNQHIF